MYIETRAFLENDEIEQFKALTAASRHAAMEILDAEVEAVVERLRQYSASPQHGECIPRNFWDDLRLRRREGELSETLEIDLHGGEIDARALAVVSDHVLDGVAPWKIALVVAAHDFKLDFGSDGVRIQHEFHEPQFIDKMDQDEAEVDVAPPDREPFCEILTAALFERIDAEQNHVGILAGDREYSEVDLVEYSIGSGLLNILQENAICGWNSILFENLADILSGDLDGTADKLRDLVLEHIDGIENGVASDLLEWEGMLDAMLARDLMPFLESLSVGLNKYLDE